MDKKFHVFFHSGKAHLSETGRRTFCGESISRSTGVACMQLGRRFVGIEIDEKYFNIAAKRIERAAAQMILPLEGQR